MIQIAHEGHQGIVRTKQMLQAHVWFPGINVQWNNMWNKMLVNVLDAKQPHLQIIENH